MSNAAEFSTDTRGPDGRGEYRFTLWREDLQADRSLFNRGICQFICLNPSTADERKDDPTVRRCWGFAQNWGFDLFVMTNIFALRATDPRVMLGHPEPVGEKNDAWIIQTALVADLIVFAWGTHGAHLGRADAVIAMLRADGLIQKCHTIARTKDGTPGHPLYLRKDLAPIPFEK